jgi:murein DD-endopeptidase MepM/ murein hydrolase activator NlpD
VPAAGQAHEYPQKVRSKIALYAASPVVVVGGWAMPLPKGRYVVGSGFGPRGGRLHAGVDLIAGKEVPIYAASAGTVARVVCDNGNCDVDGSPSTSGCGWYAEIRHAGNLTTRYCHMLRRPAVSVGQQVAAGQQIGVVGTSGHSSGPHLHFEVHTGFPAHNSNAIDPITFLRNAGVQP